MTREQLTIWTTELRNHPEQQQANYLANRDYTKFCCLGKFCDLFGVRSSHGWYGDIDPLVHPDAAWNTFLPPSMARFFGGSISGAFEAMGMPYLKGEDPEGNPYHHASASSANDAGIPWSVIADHFDKYYPCADADYCTDDREDALAKAHDLLK